MASSRPSLVLALALISLGTVACSTRPAPVSPANPASAPPPTDTRVSTAVITP